MDKFISVPYINQSIRYPTGCESVSSVMLLQYLGYEITVDRFIDQYLEMQSVEEQDGVLYGPDPRECFAGNPYEEDAFGCYAPVICKTLRKIIGEDYEVTDETGKPIDELLRTYIDSDMPVIFWACINMRQPIKGPSWKLWNSGEEFMWISNEHCMLLVGYDKNQYYFNDPYENHGVIGYDRAVVEDRYVAQHMQAVGVRKR